MMVRHGRVLALALTVQLLGGVAMSAFAAPSTPMKSGMFPDVLGTRYQSYIEYLVEQNAISGYETGMYRPQRPITRAEFASMLQKIASRGAMASVDFSDVTSGHWAESNIEQAGKKSLMAGYPNETFRPDRNITRMEALAAIAKVTEGQSPDAEKVEQILKNYRDMARVPQWARIDVAKTIHNDVFKTAHKGSNWVEPMGYVTRGEAAMLMANLLMHNEMLAKRDDIRIDHDWSKVVADRKVEFTDAFHPPAPKPIAMSTLATPISSEFNAVGDKVTFVLDEPMLAPNGMVIPVGSKLMGTLVEVQPASMEEEAVMGIDITSIATPNNEMYKVSGTVASNDGMLRGSNMSEAIIRRNGSYEALKNQYKFEEGASGKNPAVPDGQNFNVADRHYVNDAMSKDYRYRFINKDKKDFVLLGVGDQVKIKLTSAPTRIQSNP